MKKLRILKGESDSVYMVGEYIGNGYFCGDATFILSRVAFPKAIKDKIDQNIDFIVREGKFSEEVPDVTKFMKASWISINSKENLLEDTELLRRNFVWRDEYPPEMIFKHYNGSLTHISYKYVELIRGLRLYQDRPNKGPISGYLNDNLVLVIMPVRVDPHKPTQELLRAALEGLIAEVVA